MTSTLAKIAEHSQASQDSLEHFLLLKLVHEISPKKILEIGVDKGFSAQSFRLAFPEAKVTGIDITDENLKYTNFNMIVGHSLDPFTIDRAKELAPFDFLFIDGDHVYNAVKNDWNNYRGMVKRGGIIAFHDSNRIGEAWEGKVDVRKVVDEIKQSIIPSIEIAHGPDSPGTTLFFV